MIEAETRPHPPYICNQSLARLSISMAEALLQAWTDEQIDTVRRECAAYQGATIAAVRAYLVEERLAGERLAAPWMQSRVAIERQAMALLDACRRVVERLVLPDQVDMPEAKAETEMEVETEAEVEVVPQVAPPPRRATTPLPRGVKIPSARPTPPTSPRPAVFRPPARARDAPPSFVRARFSNHTTIADAEAVAAADADARDALDTLVSLTAAWRRTHATHTDSALADDMPPPALVVVDGLLATFVRATMAHADDDTTAAKLTHHARRRDAPGAPMPRTPADEATRENADARADMARARAGLPTLGSMLASLDHYRAGRQAGARARLDTCLPEPEGARRVLRAPNASALIRKSVADSRATMLPDELYWAWVRGDAFGHYGLTASALVAAVGYRPTFVAACAARVLPWVVQLEASDEARNTAVLSARAVSDELFHKAPSSSSTAPVAPAYHLYRAACQRVRQTLWRDTTTAAAAPTTTAVYPVPPGADVADPLVRALGALLTREAAALCARDTRGQLHAVLDTWRGTTTTTDEALVFALLSVTTQVPVLEALARAPPRSPVAARGVFAAVRRWWTTGTPTVPEPDREPVASAADRAAVREVATTLLFLRLLHELLAADGRHVTARMALHARLERALPAWLGDAMTTLHRVMHAGGYGPLDWFVSPVDPLGTAFEPFVGDAALVPHAVLVARQVASVALHARILRTHVAQWRLDRDGVINAERAGLTSVLGRVYAAANGLDPHDEGLDRVRLFEASLASTAQHVLGHLTVGHAVAYDQLLALLGARTRAALDDETWQAWWLSACLDDATGASPDMIEDVLRRVARQPPARVETPLQAMCTGLEWVLARRAEGTTEEAVEAVAAAAGRAAARWCAALEAFARTHGREAAYSQPQMFLAAMTEAVGPAAVASSCALWCAIEATFLAAATST